MKKPPLLISVIIFAVSCFIATGLYSFFAPVVTEASGVSYFLRPGTPKKLALAELAQQGIIQPSIFYSLFIYIQKSTPLKTGEYQFPKGSSFISIWGQISTGTGLLYRPFAIIPGWTFLQLRQALTQAEGLRHDSAPLDDKQIMAQLGHPELQPEGEFFPETYFYTRGISDFIILKHALALMQTKLAVAWGNRAPNLPYNNAYDALIAASLIEKEAYLSTERPTIAGVLINRLDHNMLLQFDPTVIYGVGQRYDGKIHKADLLDDNPFNTYVHKGLPPTPIAMPSLSSIEAALHPELHDYYYFVAKGDGSHQFSKTLNEHNAAVSTAIKQQPATPAPVQPKAKVSPKVSTLLHPAFNVKQSKSGIKL